MRRPGRESAAAVRLLLLVCFASLEAFPQFSISGSRLLLGDAVFAVRGVVYANAPIGSPPSDVLDASNCLYPRDFPLIAGLGANTIRTRERVSPEDRVFRRTLESAGLYWIAGFPVNLGDPRGEILDDISAYAAGWADEPRLLALSIDGVADRDFYTLLAEASARLHAEVPGLLITSSVGDPREIGAFDRSTQDVSLPDLDFWSIDLSGQSSIAQAILAVRGRTGKPFLVSGFGVDAYDDGAGAADPPVQALYAGLLAEEIESLLEAGVTGLLGGLYADFADQWGRGGPDPAVHGPGGRQAEGSPDGVWNAAWTGLFGLTKTGVEGLDSLRERPAYQQLAQVWGGFPPAELTLSGRPVIAADGVRNAASGMPLLAPGALLEAAGEELAAGVAQTVTPMDLPFHLGATSVCLDGEAAPLLLAEPSLARGITPWSVRPGVASAVVFRAGAASSPAEVEVREAAPGILSGAVYRPGLPCPVNEDNGVPPGAYLEVYGTGLGAAMAPQQNGIAPGAAVGALLQPSAWLGPYVIPVLYSGLFPGAPGVYQTNVRLSPDAGAGPVELQLEQNGVYSNVHRLRILGESDPPGFALGAPEIEEVVIQAGGPAQTVYLDLKGLNGFCSLVRFELNGLPPGLRGSIPVGLPGQRVPLTLWAEPGAAPAEGAQVMVTAASTIAQRPSRTVRVTVLPASGDVRLRVVSGGWLSGAPEARFLLEDRVLHHVQGGGPGRGFNFLTMDPQTGVIGLLRHFDTWESDEAVVALESFLRGLPDGILVLGAIADDGTNKITSHTRALMRERLGSELIELVDYQWSWAIMARTGAARPIAEGMMPNGTVVLDRVLSFPLP